MPFDGNVLKTLVVDEVVKSQNRWNSKERLSTTRLAARYILSGHGFVGLGLPVSLPAIL